MVTAAGERGAGASRERRRERGRWNRWRRPGRLCVAGVARHAAQHAVEHLLSVRAAWVGGWVGSVWRPGAQGDGKRPTQDLDL